jgi:inositol transport system substrate-binding protein
VAISNFDDQFLISMVDKMKSFAVETYGDEMEITFVDGKDDPAKQLGQIENFVTQGMDKIIVVPVDSDSSDTMSKLVTDNGIDIIYCNRTPKSVYDGVYAVVSPQNEAGIM